MGIIGMIIPQMLYLIPVLYLLMIHLRSLTPRTFFAGLLGLLTPYWLVSCYLLYQGTWLTAAREFQQQLIPVMPDYSLFGWNHYLSLGIMLVIAMLCTAQSLIHTYQDKVQTRILLRTLLIMETVSIAYILIQPQFFNGLFPVLLICAAVFFGHFFALVLNRFTRICFGIILALLGIMTLFNLWMHFTLSDRLGIHRHVHFGFPGRNHTPFQLGSRVTGLYRARTRSGMVYFIYHSRKRPGRADLLLDRTSGKNGMDREIPESRQKQLDKATRFIHGKGAWMALFSFLPVIGDAILIVLGLMRAHVGIVTISMTIGKLARYILLVAAALGLISLF